MSAAAMHDDAENDFDLEVEWELSLPTLVCLLYLNRKEWDIGGDLRVPSAIEIDAKAKELIEALREYGGQAYITLNGMKIYKDPEFPDSYEIYIKAGHASPRIPEGSK